MLFVGFEKKRPSKIVGEPIFFVGENSKISKNVLSIKKNSQRSANNANIGKTLKARARLGTFRGFGTERVRLKVSAGR